ncbi:MAG: hypothetical protein QME32_00225 [Endomicrobiia bacterium]|nr:hypothetical protein [Endomicrobiia bacterium]
MAIQCATKFRFSGRRDKADAITIPKFYFDKFKFFADMGYTPRPDQMEVHRDTSDIRVLACGTRWGKSKLSAMEALSAAISAFDRSFGWVVAPTYTLAEKVFREILFIARRNLGKGIVEASDSKMKLRFRNLGGYISEIHGKTAENPDNLLGEGLDWLIVDEAARVKRTVWEAYLSQRLIDKNGWALLDSTPKGKNWFHEIYLRGLDPLEKGRVKSFSYPTANNPLVKKDLLDVARMELPEDVYRQEYLAAFLESGGLVFRGIDRCIAGELREGKLYTTYVVGVDLAKYKDFTVIVVLDSRGQLVAFDRFNQIDWAVQKARIRMISKRYNNASILIDSTGVGDPIYEDLARESLPIAPYTFTEVSKKTLIDNLIMAIENRQITFPRIDVLINELEAFSYEMTDAGRLKRGAPQGYHDDCVIALALAAFQLSKRVDMTYATTLSDLESIRGL